MSSVEAVCVDPASVRLVWPRVGGMVKRAIDRGYTDWNCVEPNLLDGLWLLWLVWDGKEIRGVAVTGLGGGDCEIIACAGHDVRSWIHLIKDIEQYARNEGRKYVSIIGRRGWARVLPDYKQTAVVLRKEL